MMTFLLNPQLNLPNWVELTLSNISEGVWLTPRFEPTTPPTTPGISIGSKCVRASCLLFAGEFIVEQCEAVRAALATNSFTWDTPQSPIKRQQRTYVADYSE